MKKTLFIQTANEYLSKGFNCAYAHQDHKYPIGKDWKHLQNQMATIEELEAMISDVPEDKVNICIFTGKISDLIVVDIDDEQGYEELKKHGIELPETLTVSTGRGYHHYYRYSEDANIKTLAGVLEKVDIRAKGGLVVAPPSLHASGRQYKFVNEGTEIAEFPKDFATKMKELAKTTSSTEKKLTSTGREELLANRLKKGNRDQTLISVAGKLRMLGLSEEAILGALKLENRRSSEPLPESQVHKVVQSAMKYPYSAQAYELNDSGNAGRFTDDYGEVIKFDQDSGRWLYFNGKTWTSENSDSLVLEKLQARMSLIPNELDISEEPTEDEEKLIEKYKKFSLQSKNKSRLDAALDLSGRTLGVREAMFDRNLYSINTESGVIDLSTGKLQSHHPRQMLRKLSPVEYDAEATAPRWEQFLDEIFLGNKELIRWVQKAVGYSMSGSIEEEVFFILYGTGSNGKSKFIEVLDYILGDYSATAEFSSFTLKHNEGQGANNDIADLAGTRLVLASESNKGKRLNEALIKKLTGDRTMKARHLYKDYFEFPVTFKIWMATNYLPTITDDTDGTWRRLKLIPFQAQFKGEAADRHLYDKLIAEAPGILNWCLEGFRMWKSEGLGTCSDVEYKTEEFREDLDQITEFLEDYCITGPEHKVRALDFYKIYCEWAERNGAYAEKKSDFKAAMARRGFSIIKSNTNYYKGIGLKSSYQHMEGHSQAVSY
jgi:putative DNA primase/helicase